MLVFAVVGLLIRRGLYVVTLFPDRARPGGLVLVQIAARAGLRRSDPGYCVAGLPAFLKIELSACN